jgi:hypothetical protein
VNGCKSTLCLGIHAQRRRTKRKTCEQVFGAATAQDQADQIGKDLADGAAPPVTRLRAPDERRLTVTAYLFRSERPSVSGIDA